MLKMTHLDGVREGHSHFPKADVGQQVSQGVDRCQWKDCLDLHHVSRLRTALPKRGRQSCHEEPGGDLTVSAVTFGLLWRPSVHITVARRPPTANCNASSVNALSLLQVVLVALLPALLDFWLGKALDSIPAGW